MIDLAQQQNNFVAVPNAQKNSAVPLLAVTVLRNGKSKVPKLVPHQV